MLVGDFTFYWCHRLLHVPYFYKRIHKTHHEFSATSSLAAHYFHPIEFLLNWPLPVLLVILMRGRALHLATIWVWIVIRFIVATDGHSGYDFPWCPFRVMPFAEGAEYHDRHHRNNKGNFISLFYLWDFVCGTYDPPVHPKAS